MGVVPCGREHCGAGEVRGTDKYIGTSIGIETGPLIGLHCAYIHIYRYIYTYSYSEDLSGVGRGSSDGVVTPEQPDVGSTLPSPSAPPHCSP